ncbi:FIVAR domain-containing protein [Enterococcus faecium]|nr:serine protease [Enterococcus faecium]EGP5602395.1 serine protease [Enterococcus faecium]EME7096361.1 FIVAR domain-containing protein [Enterococcus faecium]EME7159550.1 FIVAR domain-containing protein [Enterococcus faecium]NTR91989.1 FIVAR domain-containing protein [Enterococcus faecium]
MKKLSKVCLFSSLLTGIFIGGVALSTHVDAASNVVMYRLYNPNNHEHFYTSSTKERDHLVKIHWGNYEGPAWNAPTNTGKLVYRLYNKGLRDHHYTASWDEVKWLTKSYGWTYEGPAWRSAPKNNHPIYRLFLKGVTSGSHHYTGSWKEVQWLTKNYGWKYEGVGWYGAEDTPSSKVNKSALQALYTSVSRTKNNNYTSASWKNFQNALTNAKRVLDNAKATQNQVNSAKNQLDSAYKGLKKNPTPTVNKNALQSLYNQVKGIAKGDYTDDAWTPFQTALNHAKNVLDNTKATQSQVDDAKNKLEAAYKGLAHKPKPAPTPQNYTVTVNHVDRWGDTISTDLATVKAGTTYTATAKSFKYEENAQDNFSYQVIGDNKQSKQITGDTTFTFTYNPVYHVYVACDDSYTGNRLVQDKLVANVEFGHDTTVNAPTVNGYIFDPRQGTTNTTLTNVQADQHLYFNYTHQYTVTVNHVDIDTNAVLSTESKNIYEGENFSTPWKNMTDQNYYLCSNDDPEVAIDITSKNGTRIINNIRKNKTITFKYKHITLEELNNQVRQKELEWLNNYRQQNGVGQMQFNDIVQKASDIRAQEIQTNFSHYRPIGGTFQDLLESLGCYGGDGENLSGDAGYVDDFLRRNPSNAMYGWTEDEGHKGNLLYNKQTLAGISHTYTVNPDGVLTSHDVFIGAENIFK